MTKVYYSNVRDSFFFKLREFLKLIKKLNAFFQKASSTLTSTSLITNNPSALFNLNKTGNLLNKILADYTGDLSACLINCSNHGICKLNSLQQFICECNQYRTGGACQSDSRPCSRNPCLNNSTCINAMNQSEFECKCSNPNLYFGIYCENKFDLCQNSSVCYNNQGHCIVNGTQPMCKCFMGYSGVNCEILSIEMLVRTIIVRTASVIAFIVIGFYVLIVILFDYTKFFHIKNKNNIKKDRFKRSLI